MRINFFFFNHILIFLNFSILEYSIFYNIHLKNIIFNKFYHTNIKKRINN